MSLINTAAKLIIRKWYTNWSFTSTLYLDWQDKISQNTQQ